MPNAVPFWGWARLEGDFFDGCWLHRFAQKMSLGVTQGSFHRLIPTYCNPDRCTMGTSKERAANYRQHQQ